jgi:hypothetical protein
MVWEGKNIDYITLNLKGPNVGHCKNYHSMLESHGDCMCLELIQRPLSTSNVLATTINLILIMEVETNFLTNGNETFDQFDVELHLFSRKCGKRL